MATVASMMQEDPNTSSLAKYYSSKIVELREVRSANEELVNNWCRLLVR